jgi:hypothetical protein
MEPDLVSKPGIPDYDRFLRQKLLDGKQRVWNWCHIAGSICRGNILAVHNEFAVQDVPNLGDYTFGWITWAGGTDSECSIALHSKKQSNTNLNFDFDIRTLLGRGEPRDFQFMVYRFSSGSYWKTELSSLLMTRSNLLYFSPIRCKRSAHTSHFNCSWSSARFFGITFARTLLISKFPAKSLYWYSVLL